MNNAPKPNIEDLPTKAQLFRSSIIAGIGAVAILITIYLPAEYAIDPTGVGRAIGLTEMGEIKVQLAEEAEVDRLLNEQLGQDQSSSVLDGFFGLFVGTAHAQEAQAWQDTLTFTLTPGGSADIKMVMAKGATADYEWTADGGRINFDLHAHGGDDSITYERGRGETSGEGTLNAAFDGNHGWFWRNRDSVDVTITLQLRGNYSEITQSN
ncbi:MAG: transmembrane anchor protein [Rhizobiales bacterium]|nr:transmembrane anchor protein [Hoeflea sp.]MBA67232.1 transmembrane anchor protein [Hyphomicrobiales bacterium]|tara:strand:- start:27837 stop:28466 length:630 start_codon:yes stop_codon:yes gene_type:complete